MVKFHVTLQVSVTDYIYIILAIRCVVIRYKSNLN